MGIVGVDDSIDLVEEVGQAGPVVGVLFGEEYVGSEDDFEGADGGIEGVLVGAGVNVLILLDFEGDEMRGHHVSHDLELGVPSADGIGN